MGVDIIGANKHDKGESYYFQHSWGGWTPIVKYICDCYPEYFAKCEQWGSNDGDGLNATNARQLGEAILNDIADGTAQTWKEEINMEHASIPDKECYVCGGTGKRLSPPDCGAGAMHCNGCDGRGMVRPWEFDWTLDLDDLKEFAEFCVASGGFAIW